MCVLPDRSRITNLIAGLGLLMVCSPMTAATTPAEEALGKTIEGLHADVKVHRQEQKQLSTRIAKMGSRLNSMRERLRNQQAQIADMETQLASINALMAKIDRKPVMKATPIVATAQPAVTPVTPAQVTPAKASAAPQPAALAKPVRPQHQTAPVSLRPAATTQPAAASSTVSGGQSLQPVATSAPTLRAPMEWGAPGLLGLLVVLIGAYAVLRSVKLNQTRERDAHEARDAELRVEVARKAAEHTTTFASVRVASSFASDSGIATHGDNVKTMQAEPVPEEVAAAVRDFDVYITYGEVDTARQVLDGALAKYPDHEMLNERLAQLAQKGPAPALVPAPATPGVAVAASLLPPPLETEAELDPFDESVAFPAMEFGDNGIDSDLEEHSAAEWLSSVFPSPPSADVLDFSKDDEQRSYLEFDSETADALDLDEFDDLEFVGNNAPTDSDIMRLVRTR